jgi:hypothetical protein
MLGLSGMVNICELLINIVKSNRPKMLIGLHAIGYSFENWEYTDTKIVGE